MTLRTEYVACIIHYRDSGSVNSLIARMGKWTAKPRECVVVDNSGDYVLDGSGSIHVRIERLPSNPGYGAAANRGIIAATDLGHENVLVLTQDAVLEDGAVAELLGTLASQPNVAVVAPLLAFLLKPTMVFSAGGFLKRDGRPGHRGLCEPIDLHYRTGVQHVSWVDGACLLVRANRALEIGLFDERYFLYVEEIDFMYRLRQAGYEIALNTAALAYQQPGNFTPYLRTRNAMFFHRKFHRDFPRFSTLTVVLGEIAWAARSMRPVVLGWCLRGIVDSVTGRMGRPPSALLRA